jgi:molybdenum cofactor cytidylyltransferase
MRFKLAILVLAAGESKRMGTPKQLIKLSGDTILQHAINQAVRSQVGDVFLVLGANAEIITDRHLLSEVNVLINDNWKSGMAGSIVLGMQHIMAQKRYMQVIIMLADQPFLKAEHLQAMFGIYKNGNAEIVVSRYQNGFGPPSLFSEPYFDALLKLEGDLGAKNIIRENIDAVAFSDFPNGHLDIDTEEDLNILKNK